MWKGPWKTCGKDLGRTFAVVTLDVFPSKNVLDIEKTLHDKTVWIWKKICMIKDFATTKLWLK